MTVAVRQNLGLLLTRFEAFNQQLCSCNYESDQKKITQIRRFLKHASPFVNLFRKFEQCERQIVILQQESKQTTDNEFLELIVEEITTLKSQQTLLNKQINELLLKNSEYDNSIIIMEIRGAVGGDEANIFANDLYLMYLSYIEQMNWKSRIINLDTESTHSLSYVQFEISGKNVFNTLQFEAGIHRVQRVPSTEVRGRTHTSTVSVAILKKPKKINVVVDTKDIRIDRFRASAAGGQHVNKTDSAIRITHQPTGIVTTSQDGRSQHENRKTAMDLLILKIYEREKQAITQNMQHERNIAIKQGERADKIRTYNYSQNRVTDHRINTSWKNLDKIILGSLQMVIDALTINFQAEQIKKIYEQD